MFHVLCHKLLNNNSRLFGNNFLFASRKTQGRFCEKYSFKQAFLSSKYFALVCIIAILFDSSKVIVLLKHLEIYLHTPFQYHLIIDQALYIYFIILLSYVSITLSSCTVRSLYTVQCLKNGALSNDTKNEHERRVIAVTCNLYYKNNLNFVFVATELQNVKFLYYPVLLNSLH